MKFRWYVYVYAGIYGCNGGHAYKDGRAYGNGGGKRALGYAVACEEYLFYL